VPSSATVRLSVTGIALATFSIFILTCSSPQLPQVNDGIFEKDKSVQVSTPMVSDQGSPIHLHSTQEKEPKVTAPLMLQGIVGFENCQFEVEIASTIAERSHGLMYRTHLDRDKGMLFVYSQEEFLRFWMLNTNIPLDLIFINGKKVVVDVQTMTPESKNRGTNLTVHVSTKPARYALEINSGIASKCGIRPGVPVTLNYP